MNYSSCNILHSQTYSVLVAAKATFRPTRTLSCPITLPNILVVRQLAVTGFPVLMHSPPWTLTQRDAAVHRGPHKSANEYIAFLRDEMADMVDRATWMVLPYHRLRHIRNLRISPMGVVPQHDRRPRPIVDYTYSGVNQDTVALSPPEAMQFGRALERLITQVVHSDPRFGPHLRA